MSSRIFFIFNIFLKLFSNMTLFFSKLTLLVAPIHMARRNHVAAPCMGRGRIDDVAATRTTERWRGRGCRAADLGAALTHHGEWRSNAPAGHNTSLFTCTVRVEFARHNCSDYCSVIVHRHCSHGLRASWPLRLNVRGIQASWVFQLLFIHCSQRSLRLLALINLLYTQQY